MPPWPQGETPLHYFARHMDDERLLELLLALGCPLDLADERGFTPRERLRQRGREDLARRLAPAPALLAGSFLQLDESLEEEISGVERGETQGFGPEMDGICRT